MIDPADRHLALLHRLQKRRLGAGARPVDLVGHEELGENRATHEAEMPPPIRPFLEHFAAQDVGGHEIGGELHPPCLEPQHPPQRLDQAGLAEPGQADEKHVPPREQGGEHLVDHPRLAVDHPPDFGAHRGEPLAKPLEGGKDGGRGLRIGGRIESHDSSLSRKSPSFSQRPGIRASTGCGRGCCGHAPFPHWARLSYMWEEGKGSKEARGFSSTRTEAPARLPVRTGRTGGPSGGWK